MEIPDITKPAITIVEDATFEEAISTMVKKQTNSLLVVDNQGVLVGVIGISDLLDAIVPEYLDGDSIASHFGESEMFTQAVIDAKDKQIKEFMTTDLTPVETIDTLMSVSAIAIANHRTHIPVVDSESKPIGVISRRGVKHIIADALNIQDEE